MKKNFTSTLLLLILQHFALAQCVVITNLPDTIQACKNSAIQVSPFVTVTGGSLITIDTTWSPATGLSSANVSNPIVNLGTTSQTYILTVQALTPFNSVVNGDFSSGNTGFSTAYTFGTGGPWGLLSYEGQYAISNDPLNTHTGFSSFFDHTQGTAAGSMMVVNGSSTANTQVWCQTIAVDPNTWYDFSAWGATCVASNPAVLQFSINNVLLGTPLALPLVTGQWVNFHATWFSGTNTSIDICIVDQQTAASGNDFAIDDIEFRKICETSDTVHFRVTNLTPSFTYNIDYGCDSDVVSFTAVNLGGDEPTFYRWDFGDGTGDTAKNPVHTYAIQGTYNVTLVTEANGCKDSLVLTVNTLHPLIASFDVDDDSVCQHQVISFTNTSSVSNPTGIDPVYFWDFGDGNTATSANAIHAFTSPGTYTVMMTVTDFVPCKDTFYRTIIVDSIPYATVVVTDTDLCEGNNITFLGDVLDIGLIGYYWDFGDGTVILDQNPVIHAYDTSGLFTVKLIGRYRICDDAVAETIVQIRPQPKIDLGEDFSFCPGAEKVTIADNINNWNPDATWLWSNGETGSSILAAHEGTYWARVNIGGCTGTDSIQVFKDCYLDVPNAFSPNNDGMNDYFLPRQLLSRSVSKFKMQIFNRWGEKIWETSALDGRGWDGKVSGTNQPTGVYIYLIEVSFANDKQESYQGNVTLVR